MPRLDDAGYVDVMLTRKEIALLILAMARDLVRHDGDDDMGYRRRIRYFVEVGAVNRAFVERCEVEYGTPLLCDGAD